MNVNYYNEFDKGAAAWLRELISAKLIPFGYVDERSITEVTACDVQGFTQCHFFAGIGGWSYALQLAGVDPSVRLWTGSPPCQPFSTAGKQLGQLDKRHLAPTFMRLVAQCRPPILFGEQVAPAIAKSWMCDLQTYLEGEDYAVGFAVLPACSVGAPHKRNRLFFGARTLYTYNKCELSTEHTKRFGDIIWSDNTHVPNAWSRYDCLRRKDGNWSRVEPGFAPLANGIPARVGRLRGYGNAIVPQVAAEFVKAFMSC